MQDGKVKPEMEALRAYGERNKKGYHHEFTKKKGAVNRPKDGKKNF